MDRAYRPGGGPVERPSRNFVRRALLASPGKDAVARAQRAVNQHWKSMCGVRKSSRRLTPVDYLVNKQTADWSPSTCPEVQRVNADRRPAEIQDEAAHFQEEDAKREGLSLHVRPGGSVLYRGYAYQPPAAFTYRRRRAAGVAGAPGGWWASSQELSPSWWARPPYTHAVLTLTSLRRVAYLPRTVALQVSTIRITRT
jgi:hypothetical protein